MIITDLELYLVEVGCLGHLPPVRTLLVRLATDRGLNGWGEACVDWKPMELAGRRDAILPTLTGRSVFDIEELHCVAAIRPPALRSAIEMASWDLVGRIARQPLCHLFGGGFRRRIPLAVRIVAGTSPQAARLARELASLGFHSQILTSTGRREADVAMLNAVQHTLPQGTELRLDASAGYDLESAWELCVAIEELPIQFVLDPIQSLDLVQMATLRRQTNTNLAAGRPIHSPADALAVVRSGAAPFMVVDLQRVGGLMPARKCGSIAQAAGLNASLASGPSLGIAAAAMLQLAAATPAFSGSNECGYHHLQDDVLVDPLEIVDGMIAVPQGPGLGVEIDRAKVERYQVT